MKKMIMVVCTVLIIGVGTIIIYNNRKTGSNTNSNSNSNSKLKEGNKPYFSRAGKIDILDEKFENKVIRTYIEYTTLLDKYEIQYDLKPTDFENDDYYAFVIENDTCSGKIEKIEDAKVENDTIKLLVNYQQSCGVCAPTYELFFVRFDKGILKDEYRLETEYQATNEVKCDPNVSYKPVIYLYPNKDMNVSIKLGKPDNLLVTYPKYNDGWNVFVTRDGNIIDSTGRTYYALYWEGNTYNLDNNIKEGFVVKGEDTIKFLEEKLEKLGLNERESNEFIMYWLPKLQGNKYNYIRFISTDEINESMPLEISPKTDNVIRILMAYKPLDSYIEVKEQNIVTPSRDGFTVVEWGGTILN